MKPAINLVKLIRLFFALKLLVLWLFGRNLCGPRLEQISSSHPWYCWQSFFRMDHSSTYLRFKVSEISFFSPHNIAYIYFSSVSLLHTYNKTNHNNGYQELLSNSPSFSKQLFSTFGLDDTYFFVQKLLLKCRHLQLILPISWEQPTLSYFIQKLYQQLFCSFSFCFWRKEIGRKAASKMFKY